MRDVRFGAFWGRVMTPASRRAASRSRGVSLVCGLLVFGPPLRDGLLPRAASFPRAVRPRRLLRDGAQSSVGKAPRGVGFYTSKKRRPAPPLLWPVGQRPWVGSVRFLVAFRPRFGPRGEALGALALPNRASRGCLAVSFLTRRKNDVRPLLWPVGQRPRVGSVRFLVTFWPRFGARGEALAGLAMPN